MDIKSSGDEGNTIIVSDSDNECIPSPPKSSIKTKKKSKVASVSERKSESKESKQKKPIATKNKDNSKTNNSNTLKRKVNPNPLDIKEDPEIIKKLIIDNRKIGFIPVFF